MTKASPLIFELSRSGRRSPALAPRDPPPAQLPAEVLRKNPPALPECSELDVVRHYTRLSQRNFSIDTHFYPLGSCTMKYNPRAANTLALLAGFSERHPLADPATGQGLLACLFELQELLAQITGMAAVSLAPMAGSQGEFAGMAMIKAYHRDRGDHTRDEVLIPDAAHGTNPATAAMCGFKVRELATGADGDLSLAALQVALGSRTAGLMLTNPSTLGVFERRIDEIARLVHGAGGLLYYDGANLNAILGQAQPGDMGFDVMHMNLHKTFSTPHGGGGPGAGAVAANARLAPYLPLPRVITEGQTLRLSERRDAPSSIGRLSAFAGNVGVLVRAYVYIRMLGTAGLRRVADYASLNANYLMHALRRAGFELAFPNRRASNEFIITLKRLKEQTGVTATDVAKRLLDKGFHAPTTYFPLLVPECLLIEPTETESLATLDAFVAAMREILAEAHADPAVLKSAPHTTPVRRIDEVRAARELDLRYPHRDQSSST